jgi:hypothetical protein
VVLGASVLPLLLLACGGASDAVSPGAPSTAGGDASAEIILGGGAADGDGTSPAAPGNDTPADESAVPNGAEGVVAAPTGVYAGTYVVPIDAELEAYARFEVSAVRFDLEGAELSLRYELPELLLGRAERIAFRGVIGADGRYLLEGDAGTASCRPEASSWICDEVLQSLQRDTDKLERLLANLPEAEARARRSVADRFSVDPIGVLHVDLR